MSRLVNGLYRTLKPLGQPAVLLGVAMIALVWAGIAFHLNVDYRHTVAAATQNAVNLSRVFERHVLRAITEVDKSVLLLRDAYERDWTSVDLPRWAANPRYASDLVTQIGVIGPDGRVIAASVPGDFAGLDLRDRDYFRAHASSTADTLFISKPLQGRASGKWSIQLTRRMMTEDGRFGGVIGASLDPERLGRLYDAIDIGPRGSITVVGHDGVVRARSGHLPHLLGQSIAQTRLFRDHRGEPNGTFWSQGRPTAHDVRRIVAFRDVESLPLIVVVALAEDDILAGWSSKRALGLAAGTALTLLILGLIGLSVRHKARLENAQAALGESEARARATARDLKVTLDNMSQGIMMVDGERRVSVMNRQTAKLLDLPERFVTDPCSFDEILAYQWQQGEFGPSGTALEPYVRDYVQGGGMPGVATGDVGIYERTRPNGTVLEIRSAPLPDGGMVRTFTDISERRRNEEHVVHLARHDALTGLPNRALMHEALTTAVARLRRHGEGFAILCLDLDKFKPVNDTMGHAAGDAVLQAVATRLRACTRETDVVGRLGGDEFAILQSGISHPDDVASLATRVLTVLQEPFEIESSRVVIGASIGIALAPESGTEPEVLLRNADLALYRAKEDGRNCARVFESTMDDAARERRTLEYDLRRALTRSEFELQYQPIIALERDEIVSVEALLRWRHPKRGLLSPGMFLKVAEDMGLMVPLGEWLLKRAFRDAMTWPEHVKVAVNLSPSQFKDRNLVDLVTEALTEAGLPARRVEIDVTEGVLIDEAANVATLQRLRDLGVALALDDFGAGASSFSDLRAFRFDKIKIDGSFVLDVLKRPDCAAIVAAVSGLGRTLDVTVVAKSVETEEQLDLLRELGCTEAQGYLFSPPKPVDEILPKLLPQLVAPDLVKV